MVWVPHSVVRPSIQKDNYKSFWISMYWVTWWLMLVAKQLVSWVSITSNLLACWGLARLPISIPVGLLWLLWSNIITYYNPTYWYITTTIFVAPSYSQNIQPWINFGSIHRHLESMTTEHRNAAQRRHFETQTHVFWSSTWRNPSRRTNLVWKT